MERGRNSPKKRNCTHDGLRSYVLINGAFRTDRMTVVRGAVADRTLSTGGKRGDDIMAATCCVTFPPREHTIVTRVYISY